MPRHIPPQVSLRAFREWRGLTLDELAEGIRDHGVTVSTAHITNVELGHKLASCVVMEAWARVLGINPDLIRVDPQVRQLAAAVDRDRPALQPAAA